FVGNEIPKPASAPLIFHEEKDDYRKLKGKVEGCCVIIGMNFGFWVLSFDLQWRGWWRWLQVRMRKRWICNLLAGIEG
ncbi:hypothetical protein A2U01_0034234, partial [Trifolium medium]|nr:hypothetical protein [Trifolium medium]